MRMWFATVAIATLSTGALAHENAATSASVPQTNAVIEQAAKVVDAFHEALAKGDRDGALKRLDENVQIFEQGHVEHSRAEYAAAHLEGDMEFSSAVTRKQTARTGAIVGKLAYVVSEEAVTGTFQGKPIDSVSIETMVLQRSAAGWRIQHIHWSSRNAKK